MKRISFFLALALIVASFGLANAASVSLDAVSGTWDDAGTTKIIPGTPVDFTIRLTNAGATATGLTNGFSVCVDAGAFTPVSGTADPAFSDLFTLGFFINTFSADGAGCDTIGFGGASLGSPILATGDDLTPYVINTGGFSEGQTVCLDSSYYPPSGSWLWAPTGAPAWDGPHCFLVEQPDCQPPTFDNAPVSLSGSHCDVMSFDFDATDYPGNIPPTGPVVYSANLGTIDPSTGAWSYAPSLADVGASLSVTVTADNGTCSAEATVNLNFTNEAPVVTCPPTTSISTGSTNAFAASATDDCDGVSFSIGAVSGDVTATINANTGAIEVVAGSIAGAYTVEVIAGDGKASSSCTFGGEIIAGSLFQVEIPCIGEPEGPIFQGQHASVPVMLNGQTIDGFDLLIGYDNSALSFQSAAAGADLVADGWEYFTYRYGANGNCSNACPTGLVRLTAIAETNNGPNHPVIDGVSELAVLDFLVTNDRTMECQNIPIRFYWMDCGDNTLSTDGGNELHVSEIVYDGDPSLNPPNGAEIQDFNYGFPTYFGTQDECIVEIEGKPAPIRDVSFNNGCLFIACADAIDARGDINLNYVSNEIADAVLFSNYFVYGIGVFTINTEGQIAASDVNADGLALSVADLVYLIRVIVGDALPYPKLVASNAVVTYGDAISVDAEMGAALVVIEGNANVDLLADGMEIKTAFDGVNTRALVYSLDGNTFSGEFLATNGNVISVELGSAEGATVNAKLIPDNYVLEQNYPNPFNPKTSIRMSVPSASDVNLVIYNVTGQKVAEFSGSYEAGVHTIEWDASNMASGIYFYKMNAGTFTDTKKMVLLK